MKEIAKNRDVIKLMFKSKNLPNPFRFSFFLCTTENVLEDASIRIFSNSFVASAQVLFYTSSVPLMKKMCPLRYYALARTRESTELRGWTLACYLALTTAERHIPEAGFLLHFGQMMLVLEANMFVLLPSWTEFE